MRNHLCEKKIEFHENDCAGETDLYIWQEYLFWHSMHM